MVNALLSILSGALLSCAFEPVGKWWLAPISIATHMYAISRTKHKKTSAFLFAIAFNLLSLHWTSTFVGSTPWAHLDIAGPMDADSDSGWLNRGATAYGTRLLIDFCANFTKPAKKK